MVTSSPELMSYCKKPVDQSAMIINTAWGNTDAVFYWIKTFCHRDTENAELFKVGYNMLFSGTWFCNKSGTINFINLCVLCVPIGHKSLWQKIWSSNANSTGY